jgi:hypothetical protein
MPIARFSSLDAIAVNTRAIASTRSPQNQLNSVDGRRSIAFPSVLIGLEAIAGDKCASIQIVDIGNSLNQLSTARIN